MPEQEVGLIEHIFPLGKTDIPKLAVGQLRDMGIRLMPLPDRDQQRAGGPPGTEFLAQFVYCRTQGVSNQ